MNEDFLIRTEMSADDYLRGNNLVECERKIITLSEDLWKISLIDNISLCYQDIIGRSFLILDRKHYACQHGYWIKGEEYFLGMRLGHNPSIDELEADFRRCHLPERFRLFYVLTYPDYVTFDRGADRRKRDYAMSFLELADSIRERCKGEKFYCGHFFGLLAA